MLFRAPGKTNNFDYPTSNVHFQSVNQTNQRPVCSINNSFTTLHKCASQEKVGRNYDQRYMNYHNPSLVLKTQSQMGFEDQKYRQPVIFKPPPHPELSRTYINYPNLPLQQQCLILRKEKSQFSEKIRRAEQQIQTKDNVIRGKQKEIEQLKLIHTHSQGSKPQNDIISDLRSQKQKLYFQVIELQTEIHKIQEKYEKMQRQHYGLSQKFDELSNKSSLQMNRKISREELLQSELSLSQKRNQRLRTEYQKQINNLKEQLRENQNESKMYNKSTVLSYNQSSFTDNYASVKSQPDLQNSRIQIEKYQSEIKQKNQMIRYLEMQCLRDRKKETTQQDFNKVNSLYEECKKQLTKAQKQGDVLRKQIGTLMTKYNNSEKNRDDLYKQVKDLQYLIKEVRDKMCKTLEQNRTINKRQKENNQKLGTRIQELQSEISKSSSKFRQELQQAQKSYQKMLADLREKNSNELKTKDEQIKQYSVAKQQLMAKMVEYQARLKQNYSLEVKYDKLTTELKQVSQEKEMAQLKFAEDLDQNIQKLQKQLKAKTDELFVSQSTIMALEKELIAVKKSLEMKTNDIISLTQKLEQEKVKYQKQLRNIMQEKNKIQQKKILTIAENEELKKSFEEKISKEKDQGERQIQAKIKEGENKYKKQSERYENLISYLREQQRKLRNMIGDQERDNLNLTISVENQKQKHFEISQKLKNVKEQKKLLKKQLEDLMPKLKEIEVLNLQVQKMKELQSRNSSLTEKNKQLTFQLEKITSKLNQIEIKNKKIEEINKNLRDENEKIQVLHKSKMEQLAGVKTLNEQQKSKMNELITQKTNLNNQIIGLSQLKQEREKQIQKLKNNLSDIEKKFEQQTYKNALLQEQTKKLKLQNEKKIEEQSRRQQKLFQIESELAEARVQLDSLAQAQNLNMKYSQQIVMNLKNKQILIDDLQKNIKKITKENETKVAQLTKIIQEKQTQISKLSNLIQNSNKIVTEKEMQVSKRKQLLQQKSSLEAIIQQLQSQINILNTQCNQHLKTIQNLKKIIKQSQSISCQQRKSLDEKTQYNRQIQQSLQQLTRQLEQIKQKFLQAETQRTKTPISVEQQQKGLMVSKNSGLSQSFIADFIEIDKNALLHICDLLGVEAQEGEILRTIIEAIQNTNFLTISLQYQEILQLFGVDPQINQKTQEILISQIKSFRQTLMNLVQKVSQLQIRNDKISKQNHHLNKQLGKIDFKEARTNKICAIIEDLTNQLICTKLAVMNNKIKDSAQDLE